MTTPNTPRNTAQMNREQLLEEAKGHLRALRQRLSIVNWEAAREMAETMMNDERKAF